MRPIPTVFNNVLYRSRTEARFAVMATSLGLQANYEVEGFEKEGVGGDKYLPDFYMPAFDLWVETKPDEPTRAEWATHKEFSKAKRHAFFIGWPHYDGALDTFNYKFSRHDEAMSRTTEYLLAVCESCSTMSIVPGEWRTINAAPSPADPLCSMCECIQKGTARFSDARIMGALHLASSFNFNWKEAQSAVKWR